MARREVIQYFDDLDNSPLAESEVHTIRFSINSMNYVLDLSAKNAAAFEKAVAPYVEAAHQESVAKAEAALVSRQKANTKRNKERNLAIRTWARENGFQVSDRGQIATNIIEAYEAANK